MARKRVIDPEFWLDDKLATTNYETRLFYIGTWNFADDYGVVEDSIMKLKAQIFPYDSVDIKPILQELIRQGKLVPFESDGKKWLYIKKFLKWQKVEKPSKNRNPAAPIDIVGEDYPTTTQPVGDEEKRSEVKRSEVKLREEKRTPQKLLEEFKSNPLWDEILKKYPDRDYLFHFKEMCAWWLAEKKRLPKSITGFSNWLKNTDPDPALVADRQREIRKAENQKIQQAIDQTPRARPETLDKLKNQLQEVIKNKSIK